MPKPSEVAVLTVAGRKFDDWESIWVQARWADSFSYFRFTAAERDTAVNTAAGKVPLWQKLQFKPDDPCEVTLAGQLAITGFIETRQVAYDANQHAVMLIGKSLTAWPAKSSVDTKTGSFDKMTFEQVARKVLAPYPVGIKVIGSLDQTPFDKLQNEPGEKIWDFLERIARPRGVVLGSDTFGNFLLIGEHTMPVSADLVEGRNILKCQCVISKEHAYTTFGVSAQAPASDDNSGTAASELEARVAGAATHIKSIKITPAEQPVKTQAEVEARAKYESIWHNGTIITASITVQGWLRDGSGLWRPGDCVSVFSPMALLDHTMKIQNVTFTQDSNSGTLTTLDLVNPEYLRDGTGFDVGQPAPTEKLEPQ